MQLKNRRISVSLSKTTNLGDYESMRVQAGLEADIPDGVSFDRAYNKVFEECTKQLLEYEKDILGG